eukprot:6470966-Amphidinium_carterae.1
MGVQVVVACLASSFMLVRCCIQKERHQAPHGWQHCPALCEGIHSGFAHMWCASFASTNRQNASSLGVAEKRLTQNKPC